MGGCSSKPKTAEFEGAMEMQEDRPPDDGVRKSAEVVEIVADAGLKGIDKEHEAFECRIQNPIVEEACNDLRDMLVGQEKQISGGYDAEGDSKVERQILQNYHKNVQQLIEEEISGDCFCESHIDVKEATLKPEKKLKILAPESSQICEDPVFINVSLSELQETPMICTKRADTVNTPDVPSASSKTNVEKQVQPVMLEYEDMAPTSYDNGVSHLQQKAFLSQDEFMKPVRDVFVEARVPQESVAPEHKDLELHKDHFEEAKKSALYVESQQAGPLIKGQMPVASPRKKKQVVVELDSQGTLKEARKRVVELKSQEAVEENGDQRLVDSPKQKKEFEESKNCGITSNGACMLDNHSQVRENEVLGDKSLLSREDNGAKDEVMKAANFDVSPNDQQSLVCSLDDGVHEEWMQAKVVDDAASTFVCAESFAKSQAKPILKDLWPVDNDLQKESTGEVASDENWYILERVNVQNDNLSAVVFNEHNHMELPKTVGNCPIETSRTPIICDKDVLLTTADPVAGPQVIVAVKEKSEAQPVHVLDPVGLALKNIPAQEISAPAPDIDDVLEKLASEFERQESLARSTS